MSNRQLTILGIVAALALAWAIVQAQLSHRRSPQASGPTYLIQGLDTDAVAEIQLGKPDDPSTLRRQGQGFVVSNRNDYPAQTDRINGLFRTCLEVQTTGSLVTEHPANHEDLGVTEAMASHIVRFLKRAEGKDAEDPYELITGLVIGERNPDAGGSYVRLVDSDKVYLALQVPSLQSAATDYIDKQLTKVDKNDIVRVTVKSAESEYTLQKDGAGKTCLTEIPADKKQKEYDVDRVFEALSSLSFSDVTSAEDSDLQDISFDGVYICELKNSTVYTARIAEKDGKSYLHIDAEFTDTTPVTVKRGGDESPEELKKKDEKLQAQEAVATFSQTHQNWLYELASYQAGNLTKKLADLLEDQPKPEPEEPPAEEPTEQPAVPPADQPTAPVDTPAEAPSTAGG